MMSLERLSKMDNHSSWQKFLSSLRNVDIHARELVSFCLLDDLFMVGNKDCGGARF